MPPRSSQRKRAVPPAAKAEEGAPVKSTKKRKAPAADRDDKDHECASHDEGVEDEDEDKDKDVKPTPKKRKTKEDKDREMLPLAARTAVDSLPKAMYIGAHVSGAGGM